MSGPTVTPVRATGAVVAVHASVTVSYRELAEVIALAPGARRHIEDDPLGLLDGLERLLEDLMARFEERRR